MVFFPVMNERMPHVRRSLAVLSLLLAAVPVARAGAAPSREELLAALRARVVRPITERDLRAEAVRLQARLSDAELEAVIAGEGAPARRGARGPGGLGETTAPVLGASDSELVFVPLNPCRVFDTRLTGGLLPAGAFRSYRVAGTDLSAQGGNASGCGIPLGATVPVATAVALNLIAVSGQGYGWVSGWEFGASPQTASLINFSNVGPPLDVANMVILPITGVASQTHDISLQVFNSAVHLVADVTGYFTRVPIENLKPVIASGESEDFQTVELSDGACHELASCTVTSPVAGKVAVDALAQVVVSHSNLTTDRFVLQVETAASVSCGADDGINASDHEVAASHPTGSDIDFTATHSRVFSQTASQTRTYRVSGVMKDGASTGDRVEGTRAICTFIPD